MIPHSKPDISQADLDSVGEVLRSGMIAQGSLAQEFERLVGAYIGASYGAVASSGTAALLLALKALRIGPGKEVVIPTYVCKDVLDAVLSAGATPVLCDVDEDWLISDTSAASRISAATAAIIIPYVFGISKDIGPLRDLRVPIIEDCCQSFGAMAPQGRTGTLGVVSFFSFHATKCLTTGEGGMCCSQDADLIRRIVEIRDGQGARVSCRFPTDLSDVQAALGLSQLRRYEAFLERRRAIAQSYFSEIKRCCFTTPGHVRDRSIYFRFPLRTNCDVTALIRDFARHGIAVRRGVDHLLHRRLGLQDADFRVAVRLFETTLSIPIYPGLSEPDRERVVSRISQVPR